MKIEKVNENQIRCTLTREDLASRHIRISELAYGTEKAKSLFRDMMKQANHEFGFEAEDIPLMIEAIPMNSDSLVLIITKVEDPEELDTRFARFSPSILEEQELQADDLDEIALGVSDLFRHVQEVATDGKIETSKKQDPRSRMFAFSTLSHVMNAAAIMVRGYSGESALYKDSSGHFLLSLTQGTCSDDIFDRACNIASEYGSIQRNLSGSIAFLTEHCETLIASKAIHAISNIADV